MEASLSPSNIVRLLLGDPQALPSHLSPVISPSVLWVFPRLSYQPAVPPLPPLKKTMKQLKKVLYFNGKTLA